MPGCSEQYIIMRPSQVLVFLNRAKSGPSRNRRSFPSSFTLMKYQYPQVFKSFIVQLVKSLSNDDRAAFSFLCLGNIPDSMLDGDMATDAELYKLIKSLLNAQELSSTNMSLLKYILKDIGRADLLRELEKVELQISTGVLLENYVRFKSVDGFRRDAETKPPDNLTDVLEHLLTTKQNNQEMIWQLLEQLRQISDCHQILHAFIRKTQPSWSVFTVLLVVICELYAACTPNSRDVEVLEAGYYVCWFTETETCKLLSDWIITNGGLVSKLNLHIAYPEYINKSSKYRV